MTIRFEDAGKSLAAKAIRDMEKKLGVTFPACYRTLMLRSNGGSPEPYTYRSGAFSASVVMFLKIGKGSGDDSLLKQRKRWRKFLPSEAIPIGYDGGGNMFCLAVAGDNEGAVYFLNHEMPIGGYEDPAKKYPELFDDLDDDEDDEDSCESWPGWPALTLVADNLDEFLDGFVDES